MKGRRRSALDKVLTAALATFLIIFISIPIFARVRDEFLLDMGERGGLCVGFVICIVGLYLGVRIGLQRRAYQWILPLFVLTVPAYFLLREGEKWREDQGLELLVEKPVKLMSAPYPDGAPNGAGTKLVKLVEPGEVLTVLYARPMKEYRAVRVRASDGTIGFVFSGNALRAIPRTK